MARSGPRPPRLRVLDRTTEPDDAIPGAGLLAMKFFIATLGMLFVASLFGYIAVRTRAAVWPPEGAAGLPQGLWVSTAILLGCSGAIHGALRSIRSDRRERAARWLALTFTLGLAFLISQTLGWFGLAAREMTPKSDLYGFTFYLLTGLHAAHVVAGLVPLAVVMFRAFRGRYTAARHSGVEYQAIYWHFLDVVWVILFAVLLIGS